MVIPISIDIGDLSSEFDLSTRDIDGLKSYVLGELASSLVENWQSQAQLGLKQTRGEL